MEEICLVIPTPGLSELNQAGVEITSELILCSQCLDDGLVSYQGFIYAIDYGIILDV